MSTKTIIKATLKVVYDTSETEDTLEALEETINAEIDSAIQHLIGGGFLTANLPNAVVGERHIDNSTASRKVGLDEKTLHFKSILKVRFESLNEKPLATMGIHERILDLFNFMSLEGMLSGFHPHLMVDTWNVEVEQTPAW